VSAHTQDAEQRVPRFAHGSRVPGWDDPVDLSKDPSAVPDLAVTPVPEELRAQIESAMARYPDRRSAVIPALHSAQDHYGWCSPEAMEQVAAVMRLTPAYVDSIATFYDMFSTVPIGRHTIYVCTNISCSLRGADAIYAAMEDTTGEDPDFNLRSFECLGACDIAPMASLNGEYVGPLEPADAERIVADLRAGRPPLEPKQLRYRRAADPDANRDEMPEASEFHAPEGVEPVQSAGLPPGGDPEDRLGPPAPIELSQNEDESEKEEDGDS